MPTGYAPTEDQYSSRGWEPQRTWATPRGDRNEQSVAYRASEHYQRSSPADIVAAQRRTPDPGPDILNGQRPRGQQYGGGARWDTTTGRSWDGEAPVSHRAPEPSRAVAPHRRPPKEVTGKVTGEHVSQNHRALDSDRTVAPYRRDPNIARKVSQSNHPAYRPQTRQSMTIRPAGSTSRDLAEHEVQSQYVANAEDVSKAVAKSSSHAKFQQARAITNDGMLGEPPLHQAGWESAIRQHRAFDGAYGATTLEAAHQATPNELGRQRIVKGREAHAPSVGKVVFNEGERQQRAREQAARPPNNLPHSRACRSSNIAVRRWSDTHG